MSSREGFRPEGARPGGSLPGLDSVTHSFIVRYGAEARPRRSRGHARTRRRPYSLPPPVGNLSSRFAAWYSTLATTVAACFRSSSISIAATSRLVWWVRVS